MERDEFFRRVYEIVAQIPTGTVLTYGQIAWMLRMPQCSRRVGYALRHAPEELHLPCHRVVNSAGRLVPGWTEQCTRLEAEGVHFKANGCVDLKRSLWRFMSATP